MAGVLGRNFRAWAAVVVVGAAVDVVVDREVVVGRAVVGGSVVVIPGSVGGTPTVLPPVVVPSVVVPSVVVSVVVPSAVGVPRPSEAPPWISARPGDTRRVTVRRTLPARCRSQMVLRDPGGALTACAAFIVVFEAVPIPGPRTAITTAVVTSATSTSPMTAPPAGAAFAVAPV